MSYKMVDLDEVLRYEDEARMLKVSEVARSSKGFLSAYKKGSINRAWKSKRNGFIKRHLVQYKKKPTRRRWLALMMWAYKPSGKIPG